MKDINKEESRERLHILALWAMGSVMLGTAEYT